VRWPGADSRYGLAIIFGREVDFVVVEGRRPTHLIECNWGDAPIDRGLRYLEARLP
jgi:hypothetical protein